MSGFVDGLQERVSAQIFFFVYGRYVCPYTITHINGDDSNDA